MKKAHSEYISTYLPSVYVNSMQHSALIRYMDITIDNYQFIIEENNANNIILVEVDKQHNSNVINAIKNFILFLHKKQIQYVTIFDCKKRDRYKDILLHIYKNANNTERWLYDMATFIHDRDVLRCKIY